MEEEIKKEKKKKSLILLFLKKNKIKTLLFLFVALVANTYAWFIYNRVVSANLEAHVKSWQITIDGAMSDSLTFQIDDLYPGMPEYSDTVTLSNEGEMDAEITFKVHSIRIMDEEYTVGEGGETQASMDERVANYPFQITLESSSSHLSSGGETTISLYVNWDFGNGDEEKDALDTYWGEKSYDFTLANPTLPSLEVVVDVNVAQTNG